ncbi:prepilin-type N-terminal cleavage/methylation domain-containing protein [Candidatus Microgenomates bacterium]|nr:MAG: prepilin-type N-terminal cleavage/methylation domain-containing protein [Candidatus Microgenomates bacterium]
MRDEKDKIKPVIASKAKQSSTPIVLAMTLKNFSTPIRRLADQLSTSKGFTLIEIVIAFSIMAIVSMIGLAAFVDYSRSQSLNNAVNGLVTMFNKAKSSAQSQVVPASCISFQGYKVLICSGPSVSEPCNSNDDYEMDAVCGRTNVLIESIKFTDNNVGFDTSSTTSTSFLFKALSGGVDLSAGINTGVVRINGFGNHKDISVNKSGNITVN